MAVPAPIETQERPIKGTAKIVHLPTQETEWINKVVGHVQDIPESGSSFTTEEATPPAIRPIKDSEAFREARVVRTDVEPMSDMTGSDIGHTLSTLGVHVGGENPDTYDRLTSGNKVVSLIRRKLFHRKNQQMEKAA